MFRGDQMDLAALGQYGLGGIAMGLLAYVLKMHYESYQANTNALSELKTVIANQTAKEEMFMQQIYPLAKDTNDRVRIIEQELKK